VLENAPVFVVARSRRVGPVVELVERRRAAVRADLCVPLLALEQIFLVSSSCLAPLVPLYSTFVIVLSLVGFVPPPRPLLDRFGRLGRHNGRLSDTTRLAAGCRPPPAHV